MTYRHDDQSKEARQHRRMEAFACNAIEGAPPSEADIAMFEMFDREGWSDERRRAYIIEQAKEGAESGVAAE